ncbi:ferritin-like domain-containing protein [Maricaulis sp.]|uniref:ferritin-like domain-containing protein n=1 Tax=Maricaulis sp. TaxID=1486257 RepID=UPI0025BCE634|nr:ferritin-like domain-containing protein [Maricaulis sp.]
MADQSDILALARSVLATAVPEAKADRARAVAALWRNGDALLPTSGEAPADRPARPDRPVLVAPADVPRRRLNSSAGRVALLHAVAHIEFNAIDLAFDMVARYALDPALSDEVRRDFVDDWVGVGDDEARHFRLITGRLAELGAAYGDFPAHSGLWDAALATGDSLPARLAVAPLVLEARGLDVTPGMINRLASAGDADSADCLRTIYTEEIAHVAAGARWFRHVAARAGRDPVTWFQTLVRKHFSSGLKPPFNTEARLRADLPPEFYQALT